ncbi:MAG: DUF3857 domain-containing protein [Planctomycetes bacterium]|nr:DUF3857 domain-containing protein [Planctomycetota bacterium]
MLLVAALAASTGFAQTAQSPKDAKQRTTAAQPDAIILNWNQRWSQNDDGARVYHERRHVLLNHERAYGEFVDPRITYDRQTQTVEVLVCRTKRRDGKYVELPAYARTEVSPGGTAGWPALASIQQIVMVMPAVEPGCILELEYKITTKPGVDAPLAGDIRLSDRYPVVARLIAIDMPRGRDVAPVIQNVADDHVQQTVSRGKSGGPATTFTFVDLAPSPDEPYATPWQQRAPRFAFSDAGDVEHWLRSERDSRAAQIDESPLISKLAAEWTKGMTTGEEKLRAIQEKLAATFNYLDVDARWPAPAPRRASEALQSNYGTAPEAAAVFAAVARAAGVSTQPAVLVWSAAWLDDAPHAGAVGAYLLAATRGSQTEFWHAQHGRIQRNARWNDAELLWLDGDAVQRQPWPAWINADDSLVSVAGDLAIAEDGNATGRVTLRQTGLFLNIEQLRTSDAQNARVRELVRRVWPDAEVASSSVRSLSPDAFEAEAQLKTSKPLPQTAASWRVALAADGPAWTDVSAPLQYARVEAPVRLPAAFTEKLDLHLRWPSKWALDARPLAVEKRGGPWGTVEQAVTVEPDGLGILRTTRVASRDLSAEDMKALREAVNSLRSEKARVTLLK